MNKIGALLVILIKKVSHSRHPLRHNWTIGDYLKPQSCSKIRTCLECRAQEYFKEHQWGEWIPLKDSESCERERICNRCGKKEVKAHDWSDWSPYHICNSRHRECKWCKEVEIKESSHDWEEVYVMWDYDYGWNEYKCKRCGATKGGPYDE